MKFDRTWIEAHIPHKGSMCLLDEVVEWDETSIRCCSSTHRSADNPLRAYGRLGTSCGIEYAAQAMAVHGALIASTAGQVPRSGFLASVRSVQMYVSRLDDIATTLVASAQRLAGDGNTTLYEFSVLAQARTLLSGRAAIAFGLATELQLTGRS
jgi:predicted hotdog family 3-hydroxylacyl-ACP dehydratase